MTSTLWQGDCLELMKDIPDGSVDMVLTDPPYGTMRGADLDGWGGTKTDWDTVINHTRMLEECDRVLRTNGALVLFSQDPYTGKLMTETHGNLPFSYRLTWAKDHFANALVAKKAPVNYTEDVCVFFKKYDTLGQNPIREYSRKLLGYCGGSLKGINSDLGHRRAEHFFYVGSTQFGLCTEETYTEICDRYRILREPWFLTFPELEEMNRRFNRIFNLPPGKKYKSNILSFKKDYTGLHPTQKPIALMEDLVKTYTNGGDTVLDFTMGSGTTGVACQNLGRDFIGIELDEKYFKIASDRIGEARRRAA